MKKQRTLTQVCQVTSCFEHLKFARLFSRALDTTRQKLGLETGTSNHSYSMPFFASDILPGICNQAAIWTGDPQNSKIGTVIPERKIANKKSVLKTWFFAKIWRKLKNSLKNLLKCHDTHLKYERKRPLYPLKGWLHQNAPSTSTKTPPSPTHLLHQNTPSTNTPPPPKHPFHQNAPYIEMLLPPKCPLDPLKGLLHQNALSTSTKTPPPPTHLFHRNTPSTKTPPTPKRPLHQNAPSIHWKARSTKTPFQPAPKHPLHQLLRPRYEKTKYFQSQRSSL